eukprot:1153628-Pelagomonas_calceolata.AAC.3
MKFVSFAAVVVKKTQGPNLLEFLPTVAPKTLMAILICVKFKRQCGYAETIPKDGGRHHTPTTLNDNWTQERFDRNYKPGVHTQRSYESKAASLVLAMSDRPFLEWIHNPLMPAMGDAS